MCYSQSYVLRYNIVDLCFQRPPEDIVPLPVAARLCFVYNYCGSNRGPGWLHHTAYMAQLFIFYKTTVGTSTVQSTG